LHCFILQLSKLNLREKLGEKHDQKKLENILFFFGMEQEDFFSLFLQKIFTIEFCALVITPWDVLLPLP